jgi:hypothetical protein
MAIHHRSRRCQHLAIRAVVVACVVCGPAHQAYAAAEGDPAIVRVRSTDPSLTSLINRAATESATFQRLIENIQHSNGMVQIEPGPCGRGVRACLLMWMEIAAGNRFLRIYIDRRHVDSDVGVMASMGHELQHAVEALSEPGNTNSVRLYNFFGRLAPTRNSTFETQAAIHVADSVLTELRVPRSATAR